MTRRIRAMVLVVSMVGMLAVPTAAHAARQGPSHAVVVPAPACDNILGNLYANFPFPNAPGVAKAFSVSAYVDYSNCS